MDAQAQSILDFIFSAENGDINYDQWNLGAIVNSDKAVTEMTVAEILEHQQDSRAQGGNSAVGAGQIIYPTLKALIAEGIIGLDDVFNAETQNKANFALLEKRGYNDWKTGRLSDEDFGNNLAKEWASLPVLQTTRRNKTVINVGESYHKGVAGNKALVSSIAFKDVLASTGLSSSEFGKDVRLSSKNESGEFDPNTARATPDSGFWLKEQWYRQGDIEVARPNWETGDISILKDNDNLAKVGQSLPQSDYVRTRKDNAQGPYMDHGWWQTFTDEWTDSFVYRGIKSEIASTRYVTDQTFHPAQQAIEDGFASHHIHYLNSAKNKQHYDYLVGQIQQENDRQRRRGDSNHMFAAFTGAMLSPDSLITLGIPIGWGAHALRTTSSNFVRSALKSGTVLGAAEVPMQMGRMAYDPNKNAQYSAFAIGGATIGGGVFGGAIGSYLGRQARKDLINELGIEIALQKGIGKHFKTDIDVGGRTATIRMVKPDNMDEELRLSLEMAGGVLHRKGKTTGKKMGPVQEASNPEIIVSPEMIMKRWEAGDVPPNVRTPNEFLEHEIAKRAALIKNGGQVIINKAEKVVPVERGNIPKYKQREGETAEAFAKRKAEGKDNDGYFGSRPEDIKEEPLDPNVEIKMGSMPKTDREPEVLKDIQDIPFKGDVQAGWRKVSNTLSDAEMEKLQKLVDEAEAEAAQALEVYRKANNKILADARMEAIGRIMDSPFKYIHRNAKSSETRDLVNLLVDDGGLMQGAYRTGLVIQSVDLMKKQWDGEVDTLIRRETELYEEYLGFASNPTVGGIAVNKSFRNRKANGERAMSVEEWRDATSRALITGEEHAVPQVNQMVQELNKFYKKFRIPAEEFGVLKRGKVMVEGRDNIKWQVDELRRQIDEGEVRDPRELAEVEGIIKGLEDNIKELSRRIFLSRNDPKEDYFTRVYLPNVIEANRQAFKERVVKPWMEQQPYGYIWEKVKLSENSSIVKAARKAGNNDPIYAGQWVFKKFSTKPEAIDKRAEDMIDTILREGEILDLAAHRASSRPTFGRSRQLNIPNSFLLKDGPNGNGIADFIDLNYAVNAKIYTDRMAPAIEMSRAFARPADGVNWVDGYRDALAKAKDAEKKAWQKPQPDKDGTLVVKSEAEFEAHWAEIELRMGHLRDRVVNRVFKNPDRWDNRTAMVLKDWSHITFMGMSALSAVMEVGTVIMNHGMSRVFRTAFHDLDGAMAQIKKSAISEGAKAGALMDINMGAALAGFSETGVEAALTSRPEFWLKTAANKYFLLNGLATVTTKLKQLDLCIRVPDLLDKIIKVGDGVATTDEIADLARHGISKGDAERMAKEPIEEIDGVYMANTDAWRNDEMVRIFRAGVKQGNENTIIAASAADKPMVADGVVYLKSNPVVDKYAKSLGFERRGNHWKAQSGLMALPFTFWNYAIGATNKILLSGLDEPTSQKLAGIASMVGLGYMIASIKTPSERWDKMDMDERIRVAVESSGIVGVLSNYANLTQGSVIGLTGKNPFPWSPEHNYYPSASDAMFSIAGAGPSVARNAIQGPLTGDANMTSWALPLRNHIFLKWMFDAAVDNLEGNNMKRAG